MALAIEATNGWGIQSIDLTQSYLQGKGLERNVYLQPLAGFVKPGTVWKLNEPVHSALVGYVLSTGSQIWEKICLKC